MQEDYLIQTPRLGIRQLTLDDTDAIFDMLSHPDVMEFSLNGPHKNKQDSIDFIQRSLDSYQSFQFHFWALIHLDEQKLIGVAGLLIQELDAKKDVEIAFRIHRDHWGHGYATEATEAIRDYAFNNLGMNRLISIIDPKNTRSLRVAEKLGMSHEYDTLFHDIPIQIHTISKF